MIGPSKRKMNEKARQYIRSHPDCSYDELVLNVGYAELSKGYFFNMRNQVRKSAGLPLSRAGRGASEKPSAQKSVGAKPSQMSTATMTVEILESIDAEGFSEELKGHFKFHFLPLLKRLLPGGPTLQMVFLSDPPKVEIRRLVS